MLSQLEQACKTYSTEFSSGLVEFDSNWQRIFVTALTFRLDQVYFSSNKTHKDNSLPVYNRVHFPTIHITAYIFTGEENRVRLFENRKASASDYVNAFFINVSN